jgi:serine/threonine protein kinase
MELRRVLHLFTEVLEGLRFAHIKGVLHRDLKPSNILVRESDTQPVILDFGCAYLRDEAGLASLTTTAVGSQGYIPSEVIAEPTLRTPQHDIFSCGIILYEMLARRQPDPREYQSLTLMDHSFAMVDSVVQRAIAPATSRFTTVDDLLDAAQDCYKKCE